MSEWQWTPSERRAWGLRRAAMGRRLGSQPDSKSVGPGSTPGRPADVVTFEKGTPIHYHGFVDENGDPVLTYADPDTDRCRLCPPPGKRYLSGTSTLVDGPEATATVTRVDFETGVITVTARTKASSSGEPSPRQS